MNKCKSCGVKDGKHKPDCQERYKRTDVRQCDCAIGCCADPQNLFPGGLPCRETLEREEDKWRGTVFCVTPDWAATGSDYKLMEQRKNKK